MPIFCYKCGRELPQIRRRRKGRRYKGYLCHHCKLSILMLGNLPMFRPPRRKRLRWRLPPKELEYRENVLRMFRQRPRKQIALPELGSRVYASILVDDLAYEDNEEMKEPISRLQ